jgi:hypothetical protein
MAAVLPCPPSGLRLESRGCAGLTVGCWARTLMNARLAGKRQVSASGRQGRPWQRAACQLLSPDAGPTGHARARSPRRRPPGRRAAAPGLLVLQLPHLVLPAPHRGHPGRSGPRTACTSAETARRDRLGDRQARTGEQAGADHAAQADHMVIWRRPRPRCRPPWPSAATGVSLPAGGTVPTVRCCSSGRTAAAGRRAGLVMMQRAASCRTPAATRS